MDVMKQVGSGFKTVYTGLMLKVLAVVIGIVGALVLVGGAMNGAGGVLDGFLALLVVVGALSFTGSILELIGRIKCLVIPPSLASAKQLIIATVCLQAIAMILTVLGLLNALAGPFLPLGFAANIERVNTVFWIASEIIFILFIRAVAKGIRRSDLEQQAGTVLTLSIILIALYVVMIALALVAVAGAGAGGMGGVQAAAGGGVIASVLGLAIFVLGIITLILYARLLLAMQVACNKFAYSAAYNDGDDLDDDYDDRPRKRRRDDDYDDDDDR